MTSTTTQFSTTEAIKSVPLGGDAFGNFEEQETLSLSRYAEYGLVNCIGSIGIVGNLGIALVILFIKRLRKATNAFMFHHCILDLLKSLYSLIFARSLLYDKEPKYCNLLGGSFIVCVTSTAFNILAMVMSEAYVYADLNAGVKDSGNYCCIIFSISTIWFASIILNLGVAFLPGNPSYVQHVGHCTFSYGETRNYVLHVLWIILVSFAVCLAIMYLRKLYIDITSNHFVQNDLLKIIRATLSVDSSQPLDQVLDETAERAIVKKIEKYALTKLYTLLFMTALFVLFWYPLFTLTIVDPNFQSRPVAYKALTMFACCNAAVNPFIFICLINKKGCCRNEMPRLQLAKGDRQIDPESIGIPTLNRYGRGGRNKMNMIPAASTAVESAALAERPQMPSGGNTEGIYNEYFRTDRDNSMHNMHMPPKSYHLPRMGSFERPQSPVAGPSNYSPRKCYPGVGTVPRPVRNVWTPPVGAQSTL